MLYWIHAPWTRPRFSLWLRHATGSAGYRTASVRLTMLMLPNMLMIGAAGTNVGKTTLACLLFREFADAEITGIKVTTVNEKDGTCPRGGKGCGVCASLQGTYRIDEERDPDSNKDTSRLLAAGASRVFWLRVMREHLAQGALALQDILGTHTASICESNSLRLVVEPGVFLMTRAVSSDRFKPSAAGVAAYADRVIIPDDPGFDSTLHDLDLVDKRWILREHATAIIMAGGASRRMGRDKAMLPLDGRPMIEAVYLQLKDTFPQVLVSSNERGRYAFLGLEVIPDREYGFGPLMGIGSALQASASDLNFVVACDAPHIDMLLVREMLRRAEGYDVVVPRTGQGVPEPLFAVYRKSALVAVRAALQSGQRRVSAVFDRCRVSYIDIPDSSRITNLNTPAEYQAYLGAIDLQS